MVTKRTDVASVPILPVYYFLVLAAQKSLHYFVIYHRLSATRSIPREKLTHSDSVAKVMSQAVQLHANFETAFSFLRLCVLDCRWSLYDWRLVKCLSGQHLQCSLAQALAYSMCELIMLSYKTTSKTLQAKM